MRAFKPKAEARSAERMHTSARLASTVAVPLAYGPVPLAYRLYVTIVSLLQTR